MSTVPLTLREVAETPETVSRTLALSSGEELLLRPLRLDDAGRLAEYLDGLSAQTRRFHSYPGYDATAAVELCESISRYQKLHMTAVSTASGEERIVGVFRLGLVLPESDKWRFVEHGLELNDATDCRFSVCLADAYQGQGVASMAFPCVTDIALRCGKTRMILIGGVLAANTNAVNFYRKAGFSVVGPFLDGERREFLDMIYRLD